MKILTENKFIKEDYICIESKICALALQKSISLKENDKVFIENLSYAYLHNLKQALSAYIHIVENVKNINIYDSNDLKDTSTFFKSVDSEIRITDYTHLLILKLKSSIDLLASLIEFINKPEKFTFKDDSIIDIKQLSKKSYIKSSEISSIISIFIQDNNIINLIDIRNKIVHRGFLIKSSIFQHEEVQLCQQVEHGTDKLNFKTFNIQELLNNVLILLIELDNNVVNSITNSSINQPIFRGLFNDYNNKYEFNM